MRINFRICKLIIIVTFHRDITMMNNHTIINTYRQFCSYFKFAHTMKFYNYINE